jgi:CMP-N-acetylneuraminic acid synthetase
MPVIFDKGTTSKIIAIIPARGGSKGIPKKNLQQVNGVSLVGHAIQFAMKSNMFDLVSVSTDSEEIAMDAKENGCELIIDRPARLAGDSISDQPVLAHALIEAEKLTKTNFDLIVMLQPTSPMRSISELSEGINRVKELNYDSAWSVTNLDLHYHPRKQLRLLNDNIVNYVSEKLVTSRQQLEPTFVRTGCFYIYKKEVVLQDINLMGESCSGVVSRIETVNIDTYEDLEYLRRLSAKNGKELYQ